MPDDAAAGFTLGDAPAEHDNSPDMSVLRLHRRPPPPLPLDVFGAAWRRWIEHAAEAAACPPDYVAAPLLAAVSTLIGHARWPMAWPGWAEPPHLWIGAVGDSGAGKSPGTDCIFRDVLPELERRMTADFPERLREFRAAAEFARAKHEQWQQDVRAAQKNGDGPPLPPEAEHNDEPKEPRIRFDDVTIEKVAELLAGACPKGLLMRRDELAGWLLGMSAYNDAARPFWLEAYGGRPYRVDRKKLARPIEVPRLAVAWYGSIQPERLAEVMRGADDGLLARLIWWWPEPVPFAMPRATPRAAWAIAALDRLRLLELAPGEPGEAARPVTLPLAPPAQQHMVAFGREMQQRQQMAGGLLRSALGKARGLALRLAHVIEHLWWCADNGMAPPPAVIGEPAFVAAAHLVADYLILMAERVYGDAAAPEAERDAATLARWIVRTQPAEVHVRALQREVRLPGLTRAEPIHAACAGLVEAGWLLPPPPGVFQQRGRAAYPVNPRVFELAGSLAA